MANKLVALAVTLAVGLILTGSVLMPILNEMDYGRNTYTNDWIIGDTYRATNLEEAFTLNIGELGTGLTGTINGESVAFPIKPRESYVFVSDKAVILETYVGASAKGIYGWFFDDIGSNTRTISAASSVGGTITYNPETRTISYENGSTSYSEVVSWQYHISNNGEYRTMQTSHNWYANENDLIVAGGGEYTTGNNDTTYAYYAFNQEDFVYSGQYSGNLEIISTPVAKDIVNCNAKITIGGEEFTPWNVIVPVEVISTENSNWESLLMVIPLMVLVALMVFAVNAIRAKND